MGGIVKALAVILVMFLFFYLFKVGIDKHDQVQCYQWQEYATKYPGFYLTQNEADQCAYWNIQVDAPIGAVDPL